MINKIGACLICGVDKHSEAPSATGSILALASACEHRMTEWDPVINVTNGKHDTVPLSYVVTELTRTISPMMVEARMAPHTNWFMFLHENGASDNLFCAVKVLYGRYEIHWDPCAVGALHFHSSMSLGEWAIQEFNRNAEIQGYEGRVFLIDL